MGFNGISCRCEDNLLFAVENYIYYVSKLCGLCAPKHILVYGVAVKNACPRISVGDKLGAVVGKDGFPCANAGQNTFAPTGEAGKKVRLNKAL